MQKAVLLCTRTFIQEGCAEENHATLGTRPSGLPLDIQISHHVNTV